MDTTKANLQPCSSAQIWPGSPYPLGATWDGAGVNFSIFSENAKAVELCLFNSEGRETRKIRMPEQTDQVWHVYLPDIRPGQLYGYRLYGDYNPGEGHRFNPAKLLIDPYAKAISGTVKLDETMFGYKLGNPEKDLVMDERDSASSMPKCVVVEPAFSWGGTANPKVPWHKTVIYELHVKGFTALQEMVPRELRGTYNGLTCPGVLDYLHYLGITAVELMPIHQFVSEKHLLDNGLRNYWGYNSIGFLAPDSRYSSTGSNGGQVHEFKTLVKTLHREGIEVILDVVYNHTAEGNHLGPTLSYKGIDNFAYYRLSDEDRRLYMDFTGTGNTLNMTHPRTLQLIMDSLRYWVKEMHIDGFRFDLASALARELHEVDKLGAFFDIIHQDPVISQVKLIAEPWDLGEGGYQVGNFPVLWAEWNGKYRDTVRRFWRGDPGQISNMAYRIAGSSDLYEHTGRRPYASINYVTSHDGFTLNDLVSYNRKHNERNHEDNKDGTDDNISYNFGIEGPADDPQIVEVRERQKRNFIATLFLSQGVPMLLAGDELGRTQKGNNNAYCQDNDISWIDWNICSRKKDLLEFTRSMIRLFQGHPVLRRRRFFQGKRNGDNGIKDITWYKPDGSEIKHDDWHNSEMHSFGMCLAGNAIQELDERGKKITDDTMLIILNSSNKPQKFTLPGFGNYHQWDVVLDTRDAKVEDEKNRQVRSDTYEMVSRSLAVFIIKEA